MKNLYNVITNNTFILSFEENTTKMDSKNKLFHVITAMSVQNKILVLLKKATIDNESLTYFPVSHETKFSWVPKLQSELKKMKRIILVSEKQPYCGLIGKKQSYKDIFLQSSKECSSPEILLFGEEKHFSQNLDIL